jgi:hypothetical protein
MIEKTVVSRSVVQGIELKGQIPIYTFSKDTFALYCELREAKCVQM